MIFLSVFPDHGHSIDGVALAAAIKDGGRLVRYRHGQGMAPVPPYPWGGGKTGDEFQGWVGYILQPFKTTSSKQGVQEIQGCMIFEQVCKK